MNTSTSLVRQHFTQGLSRISHFWGFPKAMGAIYAILYLSPQALCLDDLVEQVGVTKGAISTNVRTLERLGMVHRQIQVGDRRDYYLAETDFWKIVKTVLRERQKSEFDHALRSVDESLEMLSQVESDPDQAELAHFYQTRLSAMQAFFHTLDNLVATFLALDDLRSGALERLLGVHHNGETK
ncbi:MAG: MarR family transcriptional regulator [Chloroflexota bacterium]